MKFQKEECTPLLHMLLGLQQDERKPCTSMQKIKRKRCIFALLLSLHASLVQFQEKDCFPVAFVDKATH